MKSIVEDRNNNRVVLTGKVVGAPKYSHEVFGEKFYIVGMEVPRLSDACDTLPIMVSKRMCKIESIKVGNLYEIIGHFRSYNKHEEPKSRLLLTVFTTEMKELNAEEFVGKNEIVLHGYLCKEPIYRKTPLGREITDTLLAVNRPYGKSDYIPCICWGRNARYISGLEVGTALEIRGRIQSREYSKKIGENESEIRIAYEVSVSKVDNWYLEEE